MFYLNIIFKIVKPHRKLFSVWPMRLYSIHS